MLYRIPYYYLATDELIYHHIVIHSYIKLIYELHNDIPNPYIARFVKILRKFWYHPIVLIWAHEKTLQELKLRRFLNHKSPISEEFLNLKSRNLSELIPPNEQELADDLNTLFTKSRYIKKKYSDKPRRKIPLSYIKLLEKYHNGFQIDEADHERIDFLSEHHYHDDRKWYHFQS